MLRKKEHSAIYSSKSINAINNVSACSLLFLSTAGLFPARRKISEHAVDSNVFLSAGNNPGVLKNSTEHAETLFIAFRQFPQITSISLTISWRQCTRPRLLQCYWVRVVGLGFTMSNWSLGMLTFSLVSLKCDFSWASLSSIFELYFDLHFAGFLLQGRGAPPRRLFPLKFSKTTERTIETIAYCFEKQWSIVPP